MESKPLYEVNATPLFFKSNLCHSGVSGEVESFQFLSNFYPFVSRLSRCPGAESPLIRTSGGHVFESSEHLYQWSKFVMIKDSVYALRIRQSATAQDAKRLSLIGAYQSYLKELNPQQSKASLRRETDAKFKKYFTRDRCTVVMRKALRLKFDMERNPELCLALTSTYPRRLCEHERAREGAKWGISPTTRKGENLLGVLLMKRRLELLKKINTH